jgi:hypothetical protein
MGKEHDTTGRKERRKFSTDRRRAMSRNDRAANRIRVVIRDRETHWTANVKRGMRLLYTAPEAATYQEAAEHGRRFIELLDNEPQGQE